MKIRRNVEVYYEGRIQFLDLDEQGRPVTAAPVGSGETVVQQGTALKIADQIKGPTKLELMAELKNRGIKFKATSSAKDLAALLEAPAESAAPAENVGLETAADPAAPGSGDQDVI